MSLQRRGGKAVANAGGGTGNAVSYRSDSGPVLTIRVGILSDEETTFYVEDDGQGIPDGKGESIFDQGYTTNDDGTGFGLSIVRDIVTAHGWDIEVTSNDTGGARFEITADPATTAVPPAEHP